MRIIPSNRSGQSSLIIELHHRIMDQSAIRWRCRLEGGVAVETGTGSLVISMVVILVTGRGLGKEQLTLPHAISLPMPVACTLNQLVKAKPGLELRRGGT